VTVGGRGREVVGRPAVLVVTRGFLVVVVVVDVAFTWAWRLATNSRA
jgi:hypothetical protein